MTCENNNINITIIGGSRGLGKWIANELHKDNFNVKITSRNRSSGEKIAHKMGVKYDDDNIEAIADANIIIFSVPIEYMVIQSKKLHHMLLKIHYSWM